MSSMAEVLRVWRYMEDDLHSTGTIYPYCPHILDEKTLRALGIDDLTSVDTFPKRARHIDYVALYST